MEETTLTTLCDILNKKILSHKNISEDQIAAYLRQIFEYVRCTVPTKLPYSFYLLRQNMFKMWEYGSTKDISSETAFLFGALWGGAMLSEMVEKEIEEQPRLEAMAKQNLKHLNCFIAISRTPGIKHKDLAVLSNMTTSELSQWMSRIQHENYFSFSRVGREKYYYIEKKGEEILKEMKRQQACSAESINTKITASEIRSVIIKYTQTSQGAIDNENLIPKIASGSLAELNKINQRTISNLNHKFNTQISQKEPELWENKEKIFNQRRMKCLNS